MRRTKETTITLFAAASIGAATLTGCSSKDDNSAPGEEVSPSALASPERQIAEADEPYAHSDLAELGSNADLVFQGAVESIDTGIAFEPDLDYEYKAYNVTLTEGSGPDSIRVLVTDVIDGVPITYQDRAELSVGDEAIFALNEVDPMFNFEGYHPTSNASIYPVTNQGLRSNTSYTVPSRSEAATLSPDEIRQRLGE